MNDYKCVECLAVKARILALEKADDDMKKEIGKQKDRMDSILMRLNIVLGGVVVACIMLAFNLVVKAVG